MIEKIPFVLGQDRAAKRAHLAARMMGSSRLRAQSGFGLAFASLEESAFERPVMRGIACAYNQVFERDGKLYAFVKGCFSESLKRGDAINVQLEHEQTHIFGSTSSGLKFVDGDDFLAFDFDIPRTILGSILLSMVAGGSRTDVSVGTGTCTIEKRTFHGREVSLVVEAKLKEISLCSDGAVTHSHARIVDGANAMSLADELGSGELLKFMARWNEIGTRSKAIERRNARKRDAADPQTAGKPAAVDIEALRRSIRK
ncbi:HK97 family phage prohead protease [Mesorhizobium sp. f-mel]